MGGQTLTGIQPGYWSGTGFDSSLAWRFLFDFGNQHLDFKNRALSAWAVRPGDVAAIPEPETYAMMLIGIGILGAWTRRRGRRR